jgi:rhodanese-related sulfurtransferase
MGIWSYVIAIVLGALIGLLIVSRKNNDYSSIHIINKKDFQDNMRKGQLIDVRKKDMFEKDKIKGARNFKKSQFSTKFTKLRKDQSIYIYCSNGKISFKAAKKLTKSGFRNIYVLENGFQDYNKKEL